MSFVAAILVYVAVIRNSKPPLISIRLLRFVLFLYIYSVYRFYKWSKLLLTHLNLKNFRAYKEEKFNFSKINIFMGPNNSGKSAALSAINLLAQSSDFSYHTDSPLLLNGQYEELGTYIDAVHGNRSNTPIGLEYGFKEHNIQFEVKYRSQRREIELNKFVYSKNYHQQYHFLRKNKSTQVKIGQTDIENLVPDRKMRIPEINGYFPHHNYLAFARISENEKILSDEQTLVLRQLQHLQFDVYDLFSNFDALSPFRHKPERTYVYSGESATSIGRNGANGINLIVNDNAKRGSERKGILEEVNRWFEVTGIAKGLKVNNLTPRHFEICVTDFNDREHNICDAGFGCSQVLPVLVAGLNLFLNFDDNSNKPAPILLVQEPEIHLHPNAQAALGSFFTSLANLGGQLFLETHSDYLVLRLARHIARGDIKAEDVKIFFVEPRGADRVVHRIGFNEEGIFEDGWPGDFMPQRSSESLALARERLKSKNSAESEQLTFNYL